MTLANGALPETHNWQGRPWRFRALRVLSVIYLVGTVLGTLFLVAQALIPGTAVPVTLPIQPFWPELPSGVVVTDGPAAEVVGGFTSVAVDVIDLNWMVRICLAAGSLVLGAVHFIAALSAYRLSGLFRYPGQPVFQPAVSRIVTVFAAWLMAGGLACQVLNTVAGTLAAQQTLEFHSWRGPSDAASGDLIGQSPLGIMPAIGSEIDFWPVVAGLGLLAVATMLRHGEKLEAAATESPGA